MKQILCQRSTTGLTNSNWAPFGGLWGSASAEVQSHTVWPVAGTFRNLRMRVATAPGAGKTWTFTVRKAAAGTTAFADTALTFTISDSATEGQITGTDLSVAAGDLLTLKWTATAGITGSSWAALSVEFESTTTAESGYTHFPCLLHTSGVRIGGVFWAGNSGSGFDTWNDPATHPATAVQNVVPCDGTITAMYFHCNVSPGGGTKGWEAALYKNGVKQDGTGGTVDTRVTHQGTALDSNATFSLPVTTGDTVYVELTAIDTPASLLRGSIAVRFVADTDGQSIMGGVHLNSSLTDAVRYMAAHNQGLTDAVEADRILISSVSSFTMSGLRADCVTAPGTGKSRAFQIRKNTAATALEAVVSDTNTTGSDVVDAVTIDDGDTFTMEIAPSSSPASSYVKWTMVQSGVSVPIRCTSIFGENITVQSTHTHALNMDAVSRTIDLPNTLFVAPNLTMPEVSSTPTPVANMGRIYFDDNGAGKTRLMVQFGSGAAQQIAIEP